jgi:hypothetical protein
MEARVNLNTGHTGGRRASGSGAIWSHESCIHGLVSTAANQHNHEGLEDDLKIPDQ